MQTLDIIGLTFQTGGGILIAHTALSVHYRFWKEHKVDEQVFNEMGRERKRGIIGIMLIVIGYMFHIFA